MFLIEQVGSSGAESGADPVLVHSPSDLLLAAECEFRYLRRLDEALGRSPQHDPPEDVLLDRTAQLGERHERRELRGFESEFGPFDPISGHGVVRIGSPTLTHEGLTAAHEQTMAALSAGADVVYQASFYDGRFHGRADFLVRTDGAYAVVDTKLARRAKVPALLQLAAYAEQLLAAGVPVAPSAFLLLGTGARTEHRLADLLPVFRDRRRRMLALADAHLAPPSSGAAPTRWDDPDVRSCGRCDYCRREAAAHRDVLLAGGVYERQRRCLRAAGITTIDQLAAATTPPEGMSRSAFESIRDRAALQVGVARPDGVTHWTAADGPHELAWQLVDRGPILRLPPASPGDIFFDFEGDPLWSDDEGTTWGLDYLFGYVERPRAVGDRPPFGAFYAHDLPAERQALIGFLDYLTKRRQQFPDLHVYHYAPYEKTHLAAIAARHGVAEDDVDDLLRDGVLVDLYAVVRSAIRISDKSMSLKRLEPLYMGEELRTGDVKDAAASVVAYAEYCTLRDIGRLGDAEALFRQIVDYNRYDCVSTLRLSEWLREVARSSALVGSAPEVGSAGSCSSSLASLRYRFAHGSAAVVDALRSAPPTPADSRVQPTAPEGAGPEDAKGVASEPNPASVEVEIREIVGEDRARRTPDEQALAMLGAAVGYYRREAKPFWHEHYSRLAAPVDEWLGRRNAFLVDGAVVVTSWGTEPGKRVPSRVLELTGVLPEGSDLRAGTTPYLLYDPPLPPEAKTSTDGFRGWRTGGSILDVARRLTPAGARDVLLVRETLTRGCDPFDHLPMALTPAPGPATRAQEAAVEHAARLAVASWHTSGLAPGAATDLLRRRPPRLVSAGSGRSAVAAPEGPGSPAAEIPPPPEALPGAPEALPGAADVLPDASGGDFVSAIRAAARRLDRSYLAVQGPPGTGKTFVGARVIAALVADGWRVGVVAQSHAVVENMLAAVRAAGVDEALIAKKAASSGSSPTAVCPELDGARLAAFAAEPGPRVVGGTAWDFAADRFAGLLDLLVIDEAGQFSVANTVAVAGAANRLLLLGDPSQLPQVSQGAHPEPVDESALGWLVGSHGVLPGEFGYFLPTTWRMHPALARVVSRLSYEDRLAAHPIAAERDLDGLAPGVECVIVDHVGNSVVSSEEAAEVVRQVRRHVGRWWIGASGAPGRPLAPGDVLVVAAYNAQVWAVRAALQDAGLGDVQVGTVDRFQGREAPVVVVTMAASSAQDVPRGLGFLLSRNRVNVAISRAQWRAVIVRSAGLTDRLPHTPEGLAELGAFIGLCDGNPPGVPTTSFVTHDARDA